MRSPIRQRGALSLLWCAILMALLAVGALMTLFSLRYERNLPAEIWSRAKQADLVQKTQGALTGAPSAAVRRCTVGGSVLYSNLDCGPQKSGSKAVQLHLTQGIEAPKAAPAAVPAERFEDELTRRPPAMQTQTR